MSYQNVKLKIQATKEEVLTAFKTSSRIKPIHYNSGPESNDTIKKMFLDTGGLRGYAESGRR